MNADPSPDVFISYSHLDGDYARMLTEALEARGFQVFIDERIDYGSQWPQVLQEKLDASLCLALIMTPNSLASNWVQNELARAQRKRKPIFPLLLDGESWLAVEATQYVDVRDGRLPPEDFFERLTSIIGGERPASSFKLGEAEPFPFLSFPAMDQDSIEEMKQAIAASQTTQPALGDILIGDWEIAIETKRQGSGRLAYMVLSLLRNGDFSGEWREERHQHWSRKKYVLQGEWQVNEAGAVELKGDRISELGASEYEEIFELRRESDDSLSGKNLLGEPVRWERVPEGLIDNLLGPQ